MNKLFAKIKTKILQFRTLLLLIPLVLITLSVFSGLGKIKKATLQVKKAEEKLEKVDEENQNLETRLREVKDDVYIEKQIRDKLGYAKEGEIVVILPDEEILRKLAPPELIEEETLPDPIWKKWMKVFDL